ncbi:hypothetical protein C0Q70_08282 [Pomacea canaliculata]|uniref:Uncharacterized protein n=1 Tax=Pomacea canaliculata TaxID=400727 RepID=A0A2T7PHD8_POMCA|nr:hypothetical protein C0Q70_08282 [Pomacea canaliculata]
MRLLDITLTRSPYGHSFTMTWVLTLAVMATVQQINGTSFPESSEDKEEVTTTIKERGSETKTHLRTKDVDQGYSGLEKDVDDPQGVYPEFTSEEAAKAIKDVPKDTEDGDEEKDDEDPEDVVRPPAPVKMKPQKRAVKVLLGKRPRQWPPDVMYKLTDIPTTPKWTGQSHGYVERVKEERNVRHQKPLANPRGTVQVIVKKLKEGDTNNSTPLAVYQIFIASKKSNDTAVNSSSLLTKSPPVRRRRRAISETAYQPPAFKPLQKVSPRHVNPPAQSWQEKNEGGEKIREEDNDDSDSDAVIDKDKLDRTLQKSHSQKPQTPGPKQKIQTKPHWRRFLKAPVMKVVALQDQEGEYYDQKDIDYQELEIASTEEDSLQDSLVDELEGIGTSAENLNDMSNTRVRRRAILAAAPNMFQKRSYDLRDIIREIDEEEDEDIETDDFENLITNHIHGEETEHDDVEEEIIMPREETEHDDVEEEIIMPREETEHDDVEEEIIMPQEETEHDDVEEEIIMPREETEHDDVEEEIIMPREERGAANVDERKAEYVMTRPKAIANAEANGDVKKIAGEPRDAGRDVRSQERERKHADNRDERVDFTRRKQKRDDSHAFLQTIDTEFSLVPPAARVLPSITPSRADTRHTMEFFHDETRREGKHKKKKRQAAGEWWKDSPPADSNDSGGLNVRATHSRSIAAMDSIQQQDIKASPADDHNYPLQEEPQERSGVKVGDSFGSFDETVKQDEEREEEDDSSDLTKKRGTQTLRPQRSQANGNENKNIPDDSNDTGGFNIRMSHGRPHVHYDNENSANKFPDSSLQKIDESEPDEYRVPLALSVGGTDVPTIMPISSHDALHDMLNIPRNLHDASPTTSLKGLDQQRTSTTALPMTTAHRQQKDISVKTPLPSTPNVTPGAASVAAENNSVNTKNYNVSSEANQSLKNLNRDETSLHAWFNDGNVTAYIHSHGAYLEEGIMKERQKKALGSTKKKRSMTTGNTGTKWLNLERSAYRPIGKFEIFPPNGENFADKAVLIQNGNKYTLESATNGEDDSRRTPNRSTRSTRSLIRHPLKPREYSHREDGSGTMRNSRRRRSTDVGSQTVASHAPIKRRSLQKLDIATRYKDADRTLDDILYNVLPESRGHVELPNMGRELKAMVVKDRVVNPLTEEDKELDHVIGVLTNYHRMPSVVLDVRKGEGRLVPPRDSKFDNIIIRNEREAPKTRQLNHRARAKHTPQEENNLNSDVQNERATDKVDEEKAPGYEGEEAKKEKISEKNMSEKERIMGREMTRGVLKRPPSSSLLGSADNDETARIERELQELNNRAVAPSTRNDHAESGARRWHIQPRDLSTAAAEDIRIQEEAARRELVAVQTAAAVDNAVRKALQKVKENIRHTRNVNGDIIDNLLQSDEGFKATGGKEEGDSDGSDVYYSEDEDHRRKRNSPFVDEGIDGDVLDTYRKKRSVSFGTDGAVGSARAGGQRKDVQGQAIRLAEAAGTVDRTGTREGAGAGARFEPEVSEETDLNVDDMLIGIKQLANKVENESHKVQRILRKVQEGNSEPLVFEEDDDGPNSGINFLPSLLIVFYSLSKNAPDPNKIRDLENQTNTEVTIKRLPSPKAKEEKVHFAHANSINVRAIPKLTPAEAAPKHAEGGIKHTDKDDKDHDEVIRPAAPLKTKLQKKAASVLLSGRPNCDYLTCCMSFSIFQVHRRVQFDVVRNLALPRHGLTPVEVRSGGSKSSL